MTAMAITLEVYVEHSDLALTQTIRALPEADIGVVSDASTDPNHDVYFFWIEAPDFDRVEVAFEDDATVASYERVLTSGDRRTYGIEYAEDATLISPAINRLGGLILESRSHLNGWLLTILFQDHAVLNEFNEYVSDADYRIDVFELRQENSVDDQRQFGLTDCQAEALVCAYVHGYFDDPRQVSLEELGSILGISETAVSGRLRRGSARLTEAVIEQ